MNPSEKNNFEQDWKRILDDASVPPPSNVWEGIEARLDADDGDKVVPLAWWRNRMLWMVAASISAILLVGSGVWLNYSPNKTEGIAIKNEKNKTEPSKELKVSVSEETSLANTTKDESLKSNVAIEFNDGSEQGKIENINEKVLSLANSKVRVSSNGDAGFVSAKELNTISTTNLTLWKSIQGVILDNQKETERNIALAKTKNDLLIAPLELLAIKQPFEQEILMQKRYVFFNPNLELEIKEDIVKKKEYWAGVSFMPAAFNPNIQVVSAPTSYQGLAYNSQKAMTGNSKTGVSYSFQTQGGIKVSKHWTVEIGVNFLQGNSLYKGGGYLLNSAATNKSSNVLESAIAERGKVVQGFVPENPSSPNYVGLGQSNNSLYINVNKDIANNYQYLQVPLQAGFTLNPDGKWNYALLGGVVSNIFLRNDLDSSTGEIITTKPNDNVYKTMNLATTTGLRIQYKLSEKWRANLTGSYQQAITSGVHSDISLKSKPNIYGLGWGVRYSF